MPLVGDFASPDITKTPRPDSRICGLERPARALLEDLARERSLSPRAQHRLRRVARTLADLRGAEGDVSERYVAEAAHLRRLPDSGVA